MSRKIAEDAKELYDQIQFGHLNYERARYNPLLFDFLGMIKKDERLFDIGCGSGYWMGVYVDYGIPKERITGVDISPSNVDTLKQRGFNAMYGDVMDLQLEDDTSDFTISNGVIHHTADPFRAFEELVRITRPNGHMYLSVYNKWNPYYYIVHKATFPIRYLYWNRNKKNIVNFIYPLSKTLFQPLALLLLGRFLDDKSARALFMDQVITPRAHLFSKKLIASYAKRCNCAIETIKYTNAFFMITSIIRI